MTTSSGLPFPLGVSVGNPNISDPDAEAEFDAANTQFASLMGAQPTFMNSSVDSSQLVTDWDSNVEWSATSAAASPTFQGKIPTIALPMSSTAAGSPSADQMYKNFANGTYDSILQSMVKSWADAGFMTQVWRPGVEMNLADSTSFAGSTAAEQADWVAAFKHIYTVLHSAAQADGVNMTVAWNPGIVNFSDIDNVTQTLYPGNAYVDTIGVDVYGDVFPYHDGSKIYDWDKSGQELNSPNPVYDTSLAQWDADPVNLEHYYTDPASSEYSLDDSGGSALSLQDIIDFAKTTGKPIAICETGAGNTLDDGSNLTDNPTFVQWLSSTLANAGVQIQYVGIWDSDLGGNYAFSAASDDKPQEAAAWAKYFGVQSAAATDPATAPASPPAADPPAATAHTLTLQMSEDAYKGDAAFTVAVNGQQVGGEYQTSALHSSDDANTFLLTGDWNSGVNDVAISFINDAYGGQGLDRNLYVNSIAYDGVTYAGTSASMPGDSTDNFSVGPGATTGTGPADNLTLTLSEDAWQGNADFVLYIDGKAVTTPQVVSALHEANATQGFSFSGNFGSGAHTIGIGFVNDAYGGSDSEDRNLYVNGVTLNGSDIFSGDQALYGNTTSDFAVTTSK
ncbi:hypothetical protein ACELLULO517_18230 [Acidisoma cellulosilytica]|uniref:GH26 domain-containing protein n=1 Tax=Acidisoma cellulosilyticum TaxID=2802395 RepID=A0A963Z3J9_9PROT|nr:carbohydrate-binding domain-containing protein [Acidisoma cellulosilyticum]MCB8882190.1 hypothetical protein [Acidisoma cellulosilyticum]